MPARENADRSVTGRSGGSTIGRSPFEPRKPVISTTHWVPLRIVAAALATTTLLAAQSQAAPQPRFVAGDLADLSCKVVTLDTKGDVPHRLVVEVQNRGKASAEPLLFEIESRGKKGEAGAETFARVMAPRFARFGRPTPPGGKERYELATHLSGGKAQFAVRVSGASWHDGAAVARPDLRIGEPQQVQRTSLVGTFPVTQVTLHNPFDRDLEVLLRVKLVQPVDRVDLYGVRLPAGRAFDWVVSTRGTLPVFVPHDQPPGGPVKATGFELVDWVLVGEAPKEAGADCLGAAYRAWYRWPDLQNDVTGTVTCRGRRKKLNSEEYADYSFRGTFRVTAAGALTITADADTVDAGMLLGEVFANLMHPDFDELQAKNRLVPVAASRVAIVGPGWNRQRSTGGLSVAGGATDFDQVEDLEVQDGRIVSSGYGDSPRTSWQMRQFGAGQAVTRRSGRSDESSFSYREEGGRILPTAATRTITFGDNLFSATEVTITDLQFEGVAPRPSTAPKGDGVQALRAIWDAAWHVPTGPIEFRADFAVDSPGTDLMWQGQRRLRGKLVQRGMGRHQQHAEFEFEGSHDLARQMSLAAVIRDRWGIWYGRDFNDRLPFDEFFAGATIHAPDGKGVFAVDDGPWTEILTSGDLVRGWRRPGLIVDFTWQKFGDVQAVTRIDEQIGSPGDKNSQHWRAAVTIGFTTVKGQLLPSSFKLERIFGKDWGPEILTLTNIELR